MDENKINEATKSSPSQTGGITPEKRHDASDTVSAAMISAGTSVGDAGRSPMPGQSPTLASHTSSPLGGPAGSTGAGTGQMQANQNNEFSRHVGQSGTKMGASSPQGDASLVDSAKDAAGDLKERAGDLYEQASDWAREKYGQASSLVSDQFEDDRDYYDDATRRSMGRTRSSRGSIQSFVSENPVMVGVIGLAAGLLLGALLPRSRKEDEYFGEWADEVREQGMRYAGQFREQGLQYAQQLQEQGLQYAHEAAQRGREFVEQGFDEQEQRLRGSEGGPGRYQSH